MLTRAPDSLIVVLLVEARDVPERLEAAGRDETALECEALEVVEDASDDGKIMTRAELPGQVSWDIMFYWCYCTAKTRNPFKPSENFHTCPMMKD